MADSQRPIKATGMAIGGEALSLDSLPKEPARLPQSRTVVTPSIHTDFVPENEIDYNDLMEINRQLVSLRIRMNEVRKELQEAEKRLVVYNWEYRTKRARLVVSLSGGTEKQREAVADILCEEEYSKIVVAKAIINEITIMNRDLKADLDLLKEISNNARRLIET